MNDLKTQVSKINPLVAVVAGAAVGAGLAIAGAMALKDKKTSQKIADVVEDTKAKISKTTGELKDQAEVKKAELTKKFDQTKAKASRVVKTIKGSLYHDVAAVKSAANIK